MLYIEGVLFKEIYDEIKQWEGFIADSPLKTMSKQYIRIKTCYNFW